jgi:hypothetical protein
MEGRNDWKVLALFCAVALLAIYFFTPWQTLWSVMP